VIEEWPDQARVRLVGSVCRHRRRTTGTPVLADSHESGDTPGQHIVPEL